MNFLSGLTFLNPWFLSAFLAIPLLILLLRVIPPPPKHVTLATARFLEKLTTQKRTSHKTPWWLLLLRTFILACIILAFAHPVMRKDTPLQLTKPVLLIIDNGWASAQNWSKLTVKAGSILRDAQANDLTVRLALTAPLAGQENPLLRLAENPASLKTFIDGLSAEPWQGKEGVLAQILSSEIDESMDVVWLSSGLTGKGTPQLYSEVKDYNSLKIYRPDDGALPLVISNQVENTGSDGYLITRAVPSTLNQYVTLLNQNKNNTVLSQNQFSFSGNALIAKFEEDEDEKKQNAEKIRLAGQSTAASVLLLGKSAEKPYVGIATADTEETDSTFTDSEYYLTRALKPFAKITTGTPQSLLSEKNLSVLILPDISTLPVEQLDKLERWIDKGGLLLRFGGPATAQIDQLPTAVPMQKGERSLGGDITWENTQSLTEFSESSPFYGLELRDNITLKKHLLARPEEAKEENIWARLNDGIPFITASKKGRGLIIYIHTTADPSWSDFPLTGLYIDILRKILALAERPTEAFQQSTKGNVFLEPVLVLNAEGQLVKPSPLFKSFSVSEQDTIEPSALTPPGVYSYKGQNKVLNLGNTLKQIEPITTLGGDTNRFGILEGNAEKDFKPPLLKLALTLFFIDWAVMLYLMRLSDSLRTFLSRYKRKLSLFIIFSALWFAPITSRAQSNDINFISKMHLAYFKTGDSLLDSKSRSGLTQLQNTLIARTSVEPESVVSLDIETDTLLFFSFIYWYVTTDHEPLSEKAKAKLQSYIENGGLVIVDLGTPAAVQSGSLETEFFLSLLDGVNLPPLQQIGQDHPLRRSFYLLDRLYGRYDSPNVWASYDPDNLENSVAGLIIGGNDWAGAWASGTNEMATRTGINFTMYALTGNYKADQLHLPFILERLGQ